MFYRCKSVPVQHSFLPLFFSLIVSACGGGSTLPSQPPNGENNESTETIQSIAEVDEVNIDEVNGVPELAGTKT